MDLVMNLVDRVTCLHNGRIVAEETPATIRHNEVVQAIYLGTESLSIEHA
jgi:branched-chain amino acid transport system ATP-binding protein